MRTILNIFCILWTATVFSQTDWRTASDTVDKYVLRFKYPPSTNIRLTENGICTDERKKTDYPTKWCIWISDLKEGKSKDEIIKDAKDLAAKNTVLSEKRDTLKISGITASRITFTNTKNQQILVDLVFFEKGKYLFEFESWRPDQDKFSYFLRTFQIQEK
jgi:hypothetical protein